MSIYLYNDVAVCFMGRIFVTTTAMLISPLDDKFAGLLFCGPTSVILLRGHNVEDKFTRYFLLFGLCQENVRLETTTVYLFLRTYHRILVTGLVSSCLVEPIACVETSTSIVLRVKQSVPVRPSSWLFVQPGMGFISIYEEMKNLHREASQFKTQK
jgi:hypothetical protein